MPCSAYSPEDCWHVNWMVFVIAVPVFSGKPPTALTSMLYRPEDPSRPCFETQLTSWSSLRPLHNLCRAFGCLAQSPGRIRPNSLATLFLLANISVVSQWTLSSLKSRHFLRVQAIKLQLTFIVSSYIGKQIGQKDRFQALRSCLYINLLRPDCTMLTSNSRGGGRAEKMGLDNLGCNRVLYSVI